MITAKEARAKVEELKAADIAKQLEEVEKKVKEAINLRQTSCVVNIWLSAETIDILKAEPLNYNAKRICSEDEYSDGVSIEW